MSAAVILTALESILPAGTPIATGSVYVQKGLKAVASTTGTWPALILNVPRSRRQRVTLGLTGSYQWVHQVHVLYLDRWDTQSADYETVMARADATLQVMIDNVSENPNLVVNGEPACVEAAEDIEKLLDGPVSTQQSGLGFPLITGQLIFTVQDFYDRYPNAQ